MRMSWLQNGQISTGKMNEAQREPMEVKSVVDYAAKSGTFGFCGSIQMHGPGQPPNVMHTPRLTLGPMKVQSSW